MAEKRRYTYTQLGMLFGLFVGSGTATILFAITNDAIYFALVGFFLAIGLAIGAGLDSRRK